jgi:low temperature requirement protein LtrA
MSRRDTEEPHRAATPLELLFDLCFVVAVSQTGDQLNDALSAGHYQSGIVGFFMVFFAIWWAWVNFTWFASAYDVDDLAYRLLTFVQIVGVLILAAGVSTAFDHANFAVITIGYVVMRVAMVAQWLRAAAGDPAGRPVALRYAVGISICQVGWVARLFLPHEAGVVAFYLLALLEMLVPAWAERAGEGSGTPWHPGHINERYGLFTLIVLGECIAATTIAIHEAGVVHDESSASLAAVAAGAVLLVFSVWWWYFEHPSEEGLRMSRGTSFFWGYGHYFVFSSIAALGTGLELAAASTHGGEGTVPQSEAGLAIAIPVAVFFVVTAILQAKLDGIERWRIVAVCVTAVVVLGLGWAAAGRTNIGVAALLMGLAVTALVAVDEWRHPKHVTTERNGTESLPH